jgi:hypothetical protein
MSSELYFQGATAKLTIASVDAEAPEDLVVKAQYNPKDLQITQPSGWAEHQSIAGQLATNIIMEFGGMKASTMQVELLFDGVENNGRIGSKPDDPEVTELIAKLKVLSSVRDPYSSKEEMRHPYYCVVTWGVGGVRPFRCVIESLTTKYLMFARDGHVLRAMCTVALKEADRVQLVKPKGRARVAG